MEAKEGNYVKVHYTGTLDDGTVFDSSEGKDPIGFTVGSGQLIKGFDEAVRGMKVGDEKEIHLESKDAYGEPSNKLVQTVPKKAVANIPDIKEGMKLGLHGPQGQVLPAEVKKVTDEEVTFDLNHPLAGKALNFKIKVEDIQEKAPE